MNNPEEYSELIFGYDDIFIKDKYYLSKEKSNNQLILPIYRNGEGPYEIKEVQIQKNDIIIDAGANIGLFSLLAAKKGAKKIFAFEPSAYTYSILSSNIMINNYEKIITPVNLGIYSKRCTMDFIQTTGNIGSSRIVDIYNNIPGERCKINLVSLDEWVEENKVERVDFIKADIEGAERDLIEGARKTIKRFHPKLALCTYHLPDDPEILTKMILDIDPSYQIHYGKMKLFAW